MNVEQMRQMIAAGDWKALESAWMQAAGEGAKPAELASVLEAAVAAGQAEAAQTMAWALLAERAEAAGAKPPAELLELARALLTAVPPSDELRTQAADLYRAAHAGKPHLDAIIEASGLLGVQSPRRALQTLDVCLAIGPGSYLANRFDGRVVKIERFNETLGEFDLAGPAGQVLHIDPKNLADEFEPVGETDFRVLAQHRPEELGKLLAGDIAAVLVGICEMHNGQIDAAALKEMLVPRYIAAGEWSDWWSKARTAARRCPNLALEGRSPVVIKYHAGGLTLEQEMAGAVAAAKTPLDKLAVVQQYVREARDRKTSVDATFIAPVVSSLGEQARAFKANRPADALAAALAVDAAEALGLPRPAAAFPSPKEIIESCPHPAEVVAELAEAPVWKGALDALETRSDAADQLEALLRLVPAGNLDDVAERLRKLGRDEAIATAAAEACAEPLHHLELFVWLWKGPAVPPANVPNKVDLLTRLLKAMLELEHDWSVPPSKRKAANQLFRSALSASDYASYKAALGAMDEGVAGTIKRLVERAGGLSHTVRGHMMDGLKEHFFGLFAKAKIDPWLDKGTIWTTQAALDRRSADLKEITEVKMPANAKAIGAAAAHGDLSENAEWKFALEERDMLRARAAKLQEELAMARVLHHEDVPADHVGIGSRVTLKRTSDGTAVELTFLGPWDSDLPKNIFSYQTQLAQDLMGKKAGDTVRLKLGESEDEYRIEAIASGL